MDYLIKTERLVLRPPIESDDEELYKSMSDGRLTGFLTWEPHTNIEVTKNVIQSLKASQQQDKGYHWCICVDQKPIGIVSLIDVKRTIRTWELQRAELSYWINPDYQGKGYATEASKAVIEFGFKKLNLHKTIIAHAEQNVESKSICNKLGFKQYAHEHDAFKKNGFWHDLIWYELIN